MLELEWKRPDPYTEATTSSWDGFPFSRLSELKGREHECRVRLKAGFNPADVFRSYWLRGPKTWWMEILKDQCLITPRTPWEESPGGSERLHGKTITEIRPDIGLPQMAWMWGFLNSDADDSLLDWQKLVRSLQIVSEAWDEGGAYFPPDAATHEHTRQEAGQLIRIARSNGGLSIEPVLTDSRAVTIVPASLYGFIALEVAEYVAQRISLRRCKQCSTWFGLSGRGDRRYCSEICRTRRANEARPERKK